MSRGAWVDAYLLLDAAEEAAQPCSPGAACDGFVGFLELGVEVGGLRLGGLLCGVFVGEGVFLNVVVRDVHREQRRTQVLAFC